MIKLISLIVFLMSTTALAELPRDWFVDTMSNPICAYHSVNHMSVGDNLCSNVYNLDIINDAAEGGMLIDAYSTPSTNPTGDIRITHKANTTNTSAIHIFIDQNDFPSTNATQTIFTTTGMEAGDLSAVNLIVIDDTGATGGQMAALNVSRFGTGTQQIAGMFIAPGIRPIEHVTGSAPAVASQNWRETSGPTYTDSNTAFGSNSTDVQILVSNNDAILVGSDSPFFTMLVNLEVPASTNVTPIFQYSTASGFSVFNPVDETLGFSRSGNISWDSNILISEGWAPLTINSISKYYIRIQRTRATLPTVPTENTIFIASGSENFWDEAGSIQAQTINLTSSSTSSISGKLKFTGAVNTLPTCNVNNLGLISLYDNSANDITLCACIKTTLQNYSWQNLAGAGVCP